MIDFKKDILNYLNVINGNSRITKLSLELLHTQEEIGLTFAMQVCLQIKTP